MPKLPGTANYGMGPAAQPMQAPSPQGIAAPMLRSVDIAQQQASIPNPLQQIGGATGIAQQLLSAEDRQQKREDAIARSLARAGYFQQADQLFSEAQSGDIVSKAGLDDLTSKLADLKQKAVENYPGTNEGRTALETQLNEAHSDYFRRALLERSRAIQDQFQGEVSATTNRLAAHAYNTPSLLNDMLQSGDAFLDDAAPAMNPQELQMQRAKMRGDIAYSAIDGLLNRGDYREAQVLLGAAGTMLSPNQQGAIDRRIRGMAADEGKVGMPDLKAGPEGVLFNPATGQQFAPTPEVQQYLMGLKTAGRPVTSFETKIDTAGQTEFAKKRSQQLADDLQKFQETARTAANDAATAEQVNTLLKGIPTGNLPAEAAYQVSRFLGINQDQVASRQAADAKTGEFLLSKAKTLYPVSDADKKFIMAMSPGSPQTPEGREQLVYIYKRQAQFSQSMAQLSAKVGDLVAEGQMTEGQARRAISDWQNNLNQEYSRTFTPPKVKEKQ